MGCSSSEIKVNEENYQNSPIQNISASKLNEKSITSELNSQVYEVFDEENNIEKISNNK